MSQWLKPVEEVARLAGQFALQHFKKAGLSVDAKADGTPVTVADQGAEKLAREWLEKHYPNDGIVGEEWGTIRPEAKRRWLVDPIDGTKAFVRGVPLWGTLVALAEGDTVIAGAAYFPVTDELLVAEKGAGCFYNGQRTRVSTVSELPKSTVLTTSARQLPEGIRRVAARSQVCRTWGDCYGYLLVATGRAEVMIDAVMNPWDSAALMPIIEEAGGVFTDLDGKPTAFGANSVATNAALSAEVRALLKAPPNRAGSLEVVSEGPLAEMVTVVTQDARTGEVLMVAHADAEALAMTKKTGQMHYRSRKRGLWHKGGTSGNVQHVVSLDADCDSDAILARVIPAGPACHTGDRTCFHRAPAPEALTAVDRTIAERAAQPTEGSYTNKLLGNRNLRLKKLGEEMAELVVALADEDVARAQEEGADVLYHLLAALRPLGIGLDDVREVLAARAQKK